MNHNWYHFEMVSHVQNDANVREKVKVYVGMTDMDKMSVGFMEIVNSYQHDAIPAEKIFIHPLLGSSRVSLF